MATPASRVDRAIRQLERTHQGDSATAIKLLREVVDEQKGHPTFNEERVVKEIERLGHRATLTVQDIEALAHKIAAETMP